MLIYAAFAALWIAASDRLLSLATDDPALLARLGTFKGLAFVLATTGLLYLLLASRRVLDHPLADGIAAGRRRTHGGKLLLACMGLAAVVPVIGYSIVHLHGPELDREALAKLQAVAHLKAGEIERWMAERRGDGEVLAADRDLAERIERWLRDGDPAGRASTSERFDALRAAYGYEGVLLLDAGGRVVLSLGEHEDIPPETRRDALPQVRAGGGVIRSDLIHDASGEIHLDWLVPITRAEAGEARLVGTLVLHAEPEHILFPLIQSWPTPSASAEVVMVARDGDEVVFLNQLRHREGAALAYRFPLDSPDLPAAVAVRAGEARVLMEGRDYRGIPVLAATQPVDGTPWHLVAKIDRDEVRAPLRELVSWVAVIGFFAVAAVTAAVAMLWRQQQRALSLELRAQAAEALRESEQRYRTLTANMPGMVFRCAHDRQWTPSVLSGEVEKLTGHPAADFIGNAGRTLASVIHAEDRARVDAALDEAVAQRRPFELEHRCVRADGVVVWVQVRGRPIFDDAGRLLWVDGFVWDITERKRDEERLRQAATVFESTREGVIVTDAQQRILMVNRAFTELTGYTEDEVRGQTPRMLQSGRQDPEFYKQLWHSIGLSGHWQGEIWNRRKNGEAYPELLSVNAVRNAAGELTHYVGVFADISRLKATEAQLEFLARHDPLTSLPNRAVLFSSLRHNLELARRRDGRLALLMLDLDRFKDVNDSFGHLAGDELLQLVSQRLTGRLRHSDLITRLGGDEFTVLLDDLTHPEDAARVANEIIGALNDPWRLANGAEVRVGASIGISLFPEHGQTAEELLQHADAALYRAKAEGRGCFKYFSDDLTLAARQRIELEGRLRRAIAGDELRVHFQPQVDIASGRIVGAEALVRWLDPEHGLVSPAHFIPVAEETGLIGEIGAWVLRETCRQGVKWREAGLPPLNLAVNVSPRQFRQGDLAAMVAGVLAETGYPASGLELELTESVLMEREDETLAMLYRLREQGVRLAIDDFGTGYSSLAYLKRFPLDVLKIDKRFVDDIPGSQDDLEIATAIVAMGHALGLKVLAEGVEKGEQLECLKARGCDCYQGYLKSRPLPAEELARLLD